MPNFCHFYNIFSLRYEERLGNRVFTENELFNTDENIAKYREIMKLYEVDHKWNEDKFNDINEEIERNQKWISENLKDIDVLLDQALLGMKN